MFLPSLGGVSHQPVLGSNGRTRYREDLVDGLERAPEAFIGMLEGRNFGKLIVRVDGYSMVRSVIEPRRQLRGQTP